ncbi:MAG TPA: N-6 DNA methylase [Jatrophihabitantaceae bacterium]|nr:N-6 DNA methylase [Jatrophihabitantaceae bacterium]
MPVAGDSLQLRKARGAFFTPDAVASFIAEWAVREVTDAVLEPSCGEAALLHAAHDQFTRLDAGGANLALRTQDGIRLHGVELHPASARAARSGLAARGATADIRVADFFTLDPAPRFDAVIGNPPYIRYQDFAGQARARSRAAALRAGVVLTGLASSWAAFTIHSALFLKPGGRMGLVLPAELLTVNYAAGVRQYLMDHFATVRLVLFEERVFPGVLEEVVLLLADGYDPAGRAGTDHCELFQVRNAQALADDMVVRTWRPTGRGSKWTASMMPLDGLTAYSALTSSELFGVLEDWGQTTLGMVTGNNRYFALSPQRVKELGLRPADLIPLSPPGSRHLRRLTFTQGARTQLGADGSSIWLFRPDRPSAAARAYIAAGTATGVDEAYKCRVRTPWWRVPYLKPADLLLTYMNADTPRLCTNRAAAHHLNSVHGVYLDDQTRRLGIRLLALASVNTATMLGAELVGRAYGGGMLKIEPREADQLPVPSPVLVEELAGPLARIRGQVMRRLDAGELTQAAHLVDEVLLVDGMRLPRTDLQALRGARAELAARRTARGRGVVSG